MDAEDLPPGWAWATLDSFVQDRGASVDPSRWPEKQFTLYSVPSHAMGKPEIVAGKDIGSAKQALQPGTVLLSKINPRISRVWITADHGSDATLIGSTEWITFPSTAAVAASYLKFFLMRENVRRYLTANVAGVGGSLMRVNAGIVGKIEIPLAPAAEQTRIAGAVNALFEELDEAEAALARAREGVGQFRASLLHAACTGQLTATWRAANPPTETGADLLRRVLAESRATWERTERARLESRGTPPTGTAWKARYPEPTPPDLTGLPDLPTGWIVVPLRLLIVEGPTNGYSPKASLNEAGTLSLKLTATTKGVIDLSARAIKRLSEEIDATSTLFLKDGDLLFQRGNTPEYVGISAIYRGPNNMFVYPDLMMRVRTSQNFVSEWLWRVANSPAGRRHMQKAASGTAGTMPKVTGDTVRELPVPLPSEPELRQILEVLSQSLTASVDAVTQLDVLGNDLSQLRQSILHAAFTGRLVPQDPTDEPAAALLARLRATPPAPRRKMRLTQRV